MATVFTDGFRQNIARYLAGQGGLLPITHIAFGDGGHSGASAITPASNATALGHELRREAVSSLSSVGFSVLVEGVLSLDELPGQTLSEVGLFDSGGNLVALKTFAPKLKETDESYEFSLEFRF